jgi:Raf kinase inhibitor-like YbhB/YbcL family protein
MRLLSDSIDSRGLFDPRYTCDADNSSPELRWSEPPIGTRSYVVMAEDQSAEDREGGPFTHWLIYRVPGELSHLPAGIPVQESLPNGIRQGTNSLGKLGYTGPCPPMRDSAHSYVFRIYALSATPELPPRARRAQVLQAIGPLVLATAELQGYYERQIQQSA